MSTFSSLTRLALALAMMMATASSALAQSREEERLDRRAAKLAQTVASIQLDEHSRIPPIIMQKAKGIIVLRQFEAGFVFGAKGGFGLALKKDANGEWGPPAWIKTAGLSGGLQVGAQSLDVVLLIMNERGLRMLERPRFRIGVDATVTYGPTAASRESRLGTESALLAYATSEGLYAGATFEGGFLLADNKANTATYQEWLTVAEIVQSDLAIPEFAFPLIDLLKKIELDL